MRPILCLDFDGVCHSYNTPYTSNLSIPDQPVPGLFEFLDLVSPHFRIAIYGSRSETQEGREAMYWWFIKHSDGRDVDYLEFPPAKPPAKVSLDDRALRFTGKWPDLKTLQEFKPWNRK